MEHTLFQYWWHLQFANAVFILGAHYACGEGKAGEWFRHWVNSYKVEVEMKGINEIPTNYKVYYAHKYIRDMIIECYQCMSTPYGVLALVFFQVTMLVDVCGLLPTYQELKMLLVSPSVETALPLLKLWIIPVYTISLSFVTLVIARLYQILVLLKKILVKVDKML